MGFIFLILIFIAYQIGKVASHLKSISDSLETVKFHLESMEEILRKEELRRLLTEREQDS